MAARTRKGSKPKSKTDKKNETKKKERNKTAARKFRQNLKKKPNKYKEMKAKDRERKRVAKEEGKIKAISDMSKREQRTARKKKREYMQAYRLKKKANLLLQSSSIDQTLSSLESNQDPNDTLTSALSEFQQTDHKIPTSVLPNSNSTAGSTISAQKRAGRKTVLRNRSQLYRQNEKLAKENEALQRLVWRLQKRNTRKRKTASTAELTPRSKFKHLTEGKRLPEKVQKQLFRGIVLEEEVSRAVKKIGKKMKKKTSFISVLSGRVLKKYRMLNHFQFLPAKSQRKNRKKYLRSEPTTFCRKTPENIVKAKKAVEDFLLSERASHFSPEKKAFVKINGEKVQKRFMNDTLSALHKIFLEQSEFKTSFATFCKYRPKQVVAPKLSGRDTCLCKKCENFKLLLKALRAAQVVESKNTRDLIDSLCCTDKSLECRLRECISCKGKMVSYLLHNENELCKYYKWESAKEDRVGKNGNPLCVLVSRKVEVKCTINEAKCVLERILPERMAHEGRIIKQQDEWKLLQESITEQDLLITCDWSENWETKCSSEVQSMHFGGSRKQISLHTGFAETNQIKETFATLSDVTRHDPIAIFAHIKPILERYMTENIKYLHFKTDGPTTQYRSKKMFYIVCMYVATLYPQLENIYWNFSEAGHGKSVADGTGGTIKRSADSAIAHGADIQNIDQLLEVLLKKDLKTHLRVITKLEIAEADKLIAIPDFKHFSGTMQIHQYIWMVGKPFEINCKTLSCYRCPRGRVCKHYVLGLPYQMPPIQREKSRCSYTRYGLRRKEK